MLFFNFSVSVGDTAYSQVKNSDTLDVILSSFSMVNLFQRNLHSWRFSFHYRHIIGSDEIYTITDSLGLTAYEDQWGTATYITGAIINGIQYGTITDIQQFNTPLPHAFTLSQNYPNPFNPTTTIRYELPEQSFVSLKVFNILGQEITILVQETQNSGVKLTNFNGNTVPNGVYYYTLRAVNKSNSFT